MRGNYYAGPAIFTGIFILISWIYYGDLLFMLPYGLHEHAQADRLSVAMQYYDTGMDFFHPRTYHIHAKDGIVPVEFPIQSYLAALMGHIFGREYISTSFRLVTLLITYAGLLSLYLTCLRATKDSITSLFVPFFVYCSPVFAYYACNYLPDAAAVSVSFIGFYFFYAYTIEARRGLLRKAVIFFTLAALIKTTVALVLLAALGYLLLDCLFRKRITAGKKLYQVLSPFALSFCVLMGYFLYNRHLGNKYGGVIFLQAWGPFKNLGEVKLYFTYSLRHTYINEYFTVLHYPIVAALLMTGFAALDADRYQKSLLLFLAILFTGAVATTFLFGHQLIHHDYYFLSIWMPALTIATLTAMITIRKRISGKQNILMFNLALTSILAVIFVFAQNYFNSRVTLEDYRYPGVSKNLSSNWMRGGDRKLDAIGIDKNATILVLGEQAPNLGLFYFDRHGISAFPGSWEGNIWNLHTMMNNYGLRIMVCNTARTPEIETTYAPQFGEIFKQLYRDEQCTIYYRVK